MCVGNRTPLKKLITIDDIEGIIEEDSQGPTENINFEDLEITEGDDSTDNSTSSALAPETSTESDEESETGTESIDQAVIEEHCCYWTPEIKIVYGTLISGHSVVYNFCPHRKLGYSYHPRVYNPKIGNYSSIRRTVIRRVPIPAAKVLAAHKYDSDIGGSITDSVALGRKRCVKNCI